MPKEHVVGARLNPCTYNLGLYNLWTLHREVS
jgi:hypothetical protein